MKVSEKLFLVNLIVVDVLWQSSDVAVSMDLAGTYFSLLDTIPQT